MAMIYWKTDGTFKRPQGDEGVDIVILFSKGDLERVDNPNDDSIIVSMMIMKYPIKRILVDSGSSIDILSYDAFVRMNLSSNSLWPVTTPLMGFIEDSARVEGEITPSVTAGMLPFQSMVFMKFLIIQVPLAYNAILGSFGLNLLDTIISTNRLLVRFSTNGGVGEMRGEQSPMPLCYHMAPSPQKASAPSVLKLLDHRDSKRKGEPVKHLLTFPMGKDPARTV